MFSKNTAFAVHRFFLLTASVSGFTSVALGAFAAHGLKNTLSAQLLSTFQTGVHYQFIHTLVLLIIAMLPRQDRWSKAAGIAFIFGILLFSISLYLLVLTGIKGLGMITPFGGLFFLAGWFCLFIYAWKSHAEKNTDY